MPEKFLFTFRHPTENGFDFAAKLATLPEIAKEIGFADCSDIDRCRIFRMKAGRPEVCEYTTDHRYQTLTLYDSFGNYIDSATYPEH